MKLERKSERTREGRLKRTPPPPPKKKRRSKRTLERKLKRKLPKRETYHEARKKPRGSLRKDPQRNLGAERETRMGLWLVG